MILRALEIYKNLSTETIKDGQELIDWDTLEKRTIEDIKSCQEKLQKNHEEIELIISNINNVFERSEG